MNCSSLTWCLPLNSLSLWLGPAVVTLYTAAPPERRGAISLGKSLISSGLRQLISLLGVPHLEGTAVPRSEFVVLPGLELL